MGVTPAAFRRLVREIRQLQTEPLEGIRITTEEENILDVTGIIQGPAGTPYEGGYFKVKFLFNEDFPAGPPKCWFVTKIFHPNVGPKGEICVNTLKKDWKKEYGIGHILVTVKCLLIYPNAESALDEAAGKLLLENYEDYGRYAKLMTGVHATPKIRPLEFDVPSVIPDSKPTPTPTASTSEKEKLPTPTEVKPVTTLTSLPSTSSPVIRRRGSTPQPLLSLGNNNPTPPNLSPSNKPFSKNGENVPQSLTNSLATPLEPRRGDQNVDPVAPAPVAGKTALKRTSPTTTGGAEKRKKGLKRL